MAENAEVELLIPSEIYVKEIASFRQEFLESKDYMDGCGALRKFENPLDYIENSKLRANRKTAIGDVGSYAQQWICVRKDDKKIVGMVQYRYDAEDEFKIGYSVRPSERGKGYAKWMLKQVLMWCQNRGMKEVIIACESSNIASKNVIIKNEGIYIETIYIKSIELEKYRIIL